MKNNNIENLKKRIATGDIQAMLDLGDVYAQGAAIDYEQAFRCYMQAAEQGNATGLYNVGPRIAP